MTAYDWFKTELRPLEAGLAILVLALIGWQVISYGDRRAAEARETEHHSQVMQQVSALGDQVKAVAASKAQSDAVAAQQAQILAAQQQQAQVFATALAAIQAANRQQVAAVQTMTPDQLVAALKAIGITSPLAPSEAKTVLTTSTELEGCTKERDNLTGQLGNCHDQVATGQQIIQAQRQSLADLTQQVALQQKIAQQVDADYEQQIKVAKGGSRLDRIFKVAEAFAIGYGIRAATHR